MEYSVFAEGRFTIPSGYVDRTIIIIAPEQNDLSKPALNVSFDYYTSGKSFNEYVDEQIALMTKKLKGFKVTQKSDSVLANKLKGFDICAQFLKDKQMIYQKQSIYPIGAESLRKMIIFTLSFTQPLSNTELQLLQTCLDTFELNE